MFNIQTTYLKPTNLKLPYLLMRTAIIKPYQYVVWNHVHRYTGVALHADILIYMYHGLFPGICISQHDILMVSFSSRNSLCN